ncbi:hypothetical protein NEF87_001935 [Candidatus Lokiarchaeum ossiferum]|uniref:Uncharacterized protein n=1 Tax=Candidatus Lokiarchaeum ossiferum TaxID=2951803 RepID=A0ABY6HQF7_9ARCH|nr:hypothetical protein NEF87_001935 [Candidatus Lokiarchaeum sp. B-35]
MKGVVPIRMAEEELVDGCTTTVPTIKFPFKEIFAAKFLGWWDINQKRMRNSLSLINLIPLLYKISSSTLPLGKISCKRSR